MHQSLKSWITCTCTSTYIYIDTILWDSKFIKCLWFVTIMCTKLFFCTVTSWAAMTSQTVFPHLTVLFSPSLASSLILDCPLVWTSCTSSWTAVMTRTPSAYPHFLLSTPCHTNTTHKKIFLEWNIFSWKFISFKCL